MKPSAVSSGTFFWTRVNDQRLADSPPKFAALPLASTRRCVYPEKAMYEDFVAIDRWTSEPLHCVWKGTIVAIATRHADATDIRFAVNGKVITDYLAAQAAGRFLKHSIASGYDNGREIYTMTIDEVLDHVDGHGVD